jgi:hypothetical protein
MALKNRSGKASRLQVEIRRTLNRPITITNQQVQAIILMEVTYSTSRSSFPERVLGRSS